MTAACCCRIQEQRRLENRKQRCNSTISHFLFCCAVWSCCVPVSHRKLVDVAAVMVRQQPHFELFFLRQLRIVLLCVRVCVCMYNALRVAGSSARCARSQGRTGRNDRCSRWSKKLGVYRRLARQQLHAPGKQLRRRMYEVHTFFVMYSDWHVLGLLHL